MKLCVEATCLLYRMGGRMKAELWRAGNAIPKKPSRCALEPT
jgi:hypothetical protein